MRLRLMIFLIVLALPLVSSSIFIEPLNSVYNYGDQINVATTIVPSVTTSAHYTVDLKCGSEFTSNIFNNFYNLQSGVDTLVNVATELTNPLIYNITGPCFLRAVFNGETVNSNSFTLSKEINVESELELENLNPGDNFFISGNAVKESGVLVDGFVELFIPALNLYKSAVIIDGEFNISLNLPSNVKSGTHNYTLEVHNTDQNSRKINFGSSYGTFNVGQILKEIRIYTSSENAEPESDFIFRVDAFDQAGDSISKDVSLVVNQPKGVPFIKKVIKSGEDQKIIFFLNDTPGYWGIEASVDSLSTRKLFYLNEVTTLQTSLINNTLIVNNIGNAPYSGPLEITIGSFVEIKQINLGPGEVQKFTLRAPDGDYSISVSDTAGEQISLGSAFLTGNAVRVTDFREDVIYTFTNPWIWWLGVVLLILVIVLVQIKIRMQRMPKAPTPYVSSNVTSESSLKTPIKTEVKAEFTPNTRSNFDSGKKFDMSWFNKSKSDNSIASTNPFSTSKVNPVALFASQSQGIRERAVAIALHVGSSSPNISETLNASLSLAQETGAKVYVDGDYKIILFSPRLTKVPDNESSAISVARRIQALFLEHRSLHNDNTNFGIGVNDGEIISEIEGNKFHFTSTGNLISYAKRIASVSNMKLFVSDSLRRKVITAVKTEKTNYQGIWEVVRVIDHSPSKDFIKRFSDRNK